ncbi:MAG: 50S ribosomal protein L11 methyltransferase, partial [Acidobacteriota bacterium]|nr:50S ribosomal protein L11 methyltransferase [Acidobacteriota bacterium]
MDKEEIWYVYEVTVASEASEAVEFGLSELGAGGTEINHLRKEPTENVTVIGYFDELPEAGNTRNRLNEALRIYDFAPEAIVKIDSRRLEKTDWLSEWKKHWKPTVTERFIIAPSWEKVEDAEKIVIRIEPNMAFGTGTHETTRLCLKAIADDYESGMSFLDVGTGTGILAIAAAKLNPESNVSAAEFTACDTDANSIKIAEENAGLNEVGGIKFFVGALAVETPEADFVCANLTIDVIVPILPTLVEKAKK